MSKFVDEILTDLRRNPNTFLDYKGEGVIKDNIIICNYGAGKWLSSIIVVVNDKIIPTTYMDNYRLEVAIKNWYKTVPLVVLFK